MTRLVLPSLMPDCGEASARQLINSRNVFKPSIPIRAARDTDVGVGSSFNRAIKASSWDCG
jgi:hypothetical protein